MSKWYLKGKPLETYTKAELIAAFDRMLDQRSELTEAFLRGPLPLTDKERAERDEEKRILLGPEK